MKNAASETERAIANVVSTANDRGLASTTRPSHALARASCDSARKSDIVLLRGAIIAGTADRVARENCVGGPENERCHQRRDVPAPRLQVARRLEARRKDPLPEQRRHREQVGARVRQ